MRVAPVVLIVIAIGGLVSMMDQTALANHCGNAPVPSLPSNNSFGTSLTPKLEFSVAQIGEFGCVIERLEIQIATDLNFNNIVWSTANNGNAQNPPITYRTIPEGKLQAQTKYYWRGRISGYIDQGPGFIAVDVASNWSGARNFTTGLAAVIIQQCNWAAISNKSPSNGASVNTVNVTLEIQIGITIAPACRHEETQWQVSTSEANLSQASIGSTENLIRNALMVFENSKTYYWRARMTGPDGNSPWSQPTRFTVSAFSVGLDPICLWPAITILAPEEGAVLNTTTPTLRVQFIAGPGTCAYTDVEWNIYDELRDLFNDNMLARKYTQQEKSWAVEANLLEPGKAYFLRVRLIGNNQNNPESDWTESRGFSIAGNVGNNGPVEPPQPPPQPPVNAGDDLCDFDMNNNGLLDDPEFFVAIDNWIAEQIENLLFFGAVDAWIAQSQICASSADAARFTPVVKVWLSANANVLFEVYGAEVAEMSLVVYSTSGELVTKQQAFINRLRWNLSYEPGEPLANGIYLWRVSVRLVDGSVVNNPFTKFVIMR